MESDLPITWQCSEVLIGRAFDLVEAFIVNLEPVETTAGTDFLKDCVTTNIIARLMMNTITPIILIF